MRRYLIGIAAAGMLVILLSGCTDQSRHNETDQARLTMTNSITPGTANSTVKTIEMSEIRQTEFTLTAQESNLDTGSGKILPVWTFNNSVPGPVIRVKQGDKVKITLKNQLPEPASIHWHGIPVPISMDGVPGVTQNAVQAGGSFTYEFTASVPGTYWYHSHQDSVNQIDRGLYGAFIVEEENESINRDYTLMLDEWVSADKTGMSMDHSKMAAASPTLPAGVNPHSGHGETSLADESVEHSMSMYDLLTINGKTGTAIDSLVVKQGDKVRLRLINAGYKSHTLHLHGHEWRVTATDGQQILNPQLLKDSLLSIAPGERYDVEFEANNPGQWYLEAHGDEPGVKGMKVKIIYEGSPETKDQPNDAVVTLPFFDLSTYGQPGSTAFSLDQNYDLEYTMNLGTEIKDGQQVFTINNKVYPNTDSIPVKKGDKVKIRMVNTSTADDHPMHLHGHFFQVLSKNGRPLQGSPIIKDTLNLKPGEEYMIALEADNPGDWMFHCHELHHASTGMVTHVPYMDYKSDFVADPKVGNKPE